MRYCYPDPGNHTNTAGTPGGGGGEVPTDYYYADLSSSDADSWDLDGDGYHGEYGEDAPDFLAEVYVGRIPVNNPGRITYALDKTVTFEQDTGSWKDSALHGGAFWYFTNEDGSGNPAMDGARSLSAIESDLLSGWTVSRYSEQEGLEKSVYPWPGINQPGFEDDWRTGHYSVVNWGAHGWTDGIARKVWTEDDGDGVPEGSEFDWPYIIGNSSNLDDDYQAIVFAMSCLIGCPEPNPWGRMGVDLLTRPSWGASIGVIASARSPYGILEWPHGGSESICYEFIENMTIGGEKVGEAFYNSKYFCTTSYGWENYAEYTNNYTYNLWGDPSLVHQGIDLSAVRSPEPAGSSIRLAAGPVPMVRSLEVSYYLPRSGSVDLSIYDARGRRVRRLEGGPNEAGWHARMWNGRSESGTEAAPGIYWVRLSAGSSVLSRKVMLLR
jgi:hypothetical protein